MFYWVVKAIIAPVLRVLFRPWAEGTGNVPREGAAILASNHLSFSDHTRGHHQLVWLGSVVGRSCTAPHP